MDIHEYQAKKILSGFGIEIPEKLIHNWDHSKIKNI